MFTKIITLFVLARAVHSTTLNTEVNFQKPKLERNNVLNKGVWVRNKSKDNLFDKTRIGDFIFRENSLDVDNLLQNTFDPFGVSYLDDTPRVSNYLTRAKRAIRRIREQRFRKSLKNCVGKDCQSYIIEEPNELTKEPVKRDGKGGTAINDYPYEVAVLLNHNKKEANTLKNDTISEKEEKNVDRNNGTSNKINDNNHKAELPMEADFKDNNDTLPQNATKRSKKYDYESEVIKKYEFTEDMNKSKDLNDHIEGKVIDRNVFDKDNTVWHQNAPIPDVNVYKVVPKEPQRSKTVTERGLIKVISMLTKTFKKIMKQHTEIKSIYEQISDINDQFNKNTITVTEKFQDFDLKYLNLLKFHEKLKIFDAKLASKQEYFKNKEREMANNFKEFETQQKKFLQQQRQFYNIQKLMLAQNEKINAKQSVIAKTQSEISHRQNNFARILKKAKQLYLESRNPITKLSSNIMKPVPNHKPTATLEKISTTTPSTESVKINLFSIPTSNKIENQDDLILKEKDDQTIDDLVYKYYFNNTFIDSVMKNNILSSLMGVSHNPGVPRNVKTKRNELETTILLPVYDNNDSEDIVIKNRKRRWISHHSRHRGKRRHRGKGGAAAVLNYTDAKPIRHLREKAGNSIPLVEETFPKIAANSIPPLKETFLSKKEVTSTPVIMEPSKATNGDKPIKDPFISMAQNFCIEIKQNTNEQILNWCVEKALRRLRFVDVNNGPMAQLPTSIIPAQSPHEVPTTTVQTKPALTELKPNEYPTFLAERNTVPNELDTEPVIVTDLELTTAKTDPVSTVLVSETTVSPSTWLPSPTTVATTIVDPLTTIENKTTTLDGPAFFPNNEKLESNLKQLDTEDLGSNLKQYDLKPDLEGNVYYDGSVHASDILGSDSQGIDDIMPGLESNSRVEMDPLAFDLQAQRRAIVRKLNEKIKMSLG
ncbi:hypothetical protein PYW08_011005 [Mythimna loreyi]|uniref:Uncharacterized protein n=1 Tax=Mythimna loreyi TaxID=667449 RepID=A0ACC2Q3Z3_9NEOP|nr:hypothetical protein PYW08_011005 [Mythimna loreyi]